jgi:hypothetical protein
LNLNHVGKTHPFQILIHPWGGVARSEIGRGGGGTQPPFCFWPKEKSFADVTKVQRESLAALDSFAVEDFGQCFQQWDWRWNHCIRTQEQYFEGNYSFKLAQLFQINFF